MQRTKAALIKFHHVTAAALTSDGRQRVALMRTWQRCDDMGAPVDVGRGDPANVRFSIKHTDGDFGMLNRYDAAFIDAVGDPGRLLVEFDAWREFETHNVFPLYLGDSWAPVFQAIARKGVRRIAVRVNWNSDRYPILLSRPWANYVNIAVFLGLARDPKANPDGLLRDYISTQYPPAAREAAFAVYKASFDYVKLLYYVNGKCCADHGRVPPRSKVRVRFTATRYSEVDKLESGMLKLIAALPDGTPQRADLARGARSLANVARACARAGGAGGSTAFLDAWLKDDPESYKEMAGHLAR